MRVGQQSEGLDLYTEHEDGRPVKIRAEARTLWPKTNGDVGMLLEDMVIPPNVVD